MKSKIKTATLSVIQNLSGPVAAVALQLQKISPQWTLAIGMGAGLLTVYRELAEDRGLELLEFVNEHRDEFVETIIATPTFKAAFINVWEMHIRENSENKRRRLRNFLLNLGRGKKIEVDAHTKIYAVIEEMTDEEAHVFGIIFRNSNHEQFGHMNLNPTGIKELTGYLESQIIDVCNSLHAYRLITIRDNATIGSMVTIQQITPFGNLFYDFVCIE